MTGEAKQESYGQLMRLVISSVQQNMSSPLCPFLMMSDVFDTSTLQECEPFFRYVEANVGVWKSDIFFDKGKNYLLRMCNDLLRRLSRSQNTIFCGRIQLFLAHLFPLKEKSGLNLVSQFNIENKTIYNAKSEFSPVAAATAALKKEEGELDATTDAESTMETEASSSSSAAKPEEPIIDHVLYKKFWSLQDFFNKPTKLYDKANWKSFHSHLNAVIKVFESYKLDDVKVNKGAAASTTTSSSSSSSLSAADDVIFAKYLTNEKLLDLQLNDSTVRRNILLQLLIVFQYLNAPVKFKMPTLLLNEDQDSAVKQLTEKVYALLRVC